VDDFSATDRTGTSPFVNVEVEAALLGAIFMDNKVYERVSEILKAEHFADAVHGQIYEASSRLIAAGRPASPLTLKDRFERHDPIREGLTVPDYLGRLIVEATTTANAKAYAEIIVENSRRREFIDLTGRMMEQAFHVNVDSRNLIERFEVELFRLAETGRASREVTFGTAAKEAVDQVAEAYRRGGAIMGVSTGLVDLDNKLGGLQNSDVIILAGRPAMGKTALATNIAFAAAKAAKLVDGKYDGHVHFFSQEMTAAQLAMRQLSEQTTLSSERMRRGLITEAEFKVLDEVARSLGDLPYTIDETGGLTLAQLATKARRLKRQKRTSLIVIDYIQLMQGGPSSGQNRVQDITAITTGIKALAKELNVPILALSQLSRKVEERADKRPQLADLRDSGSIEQDADVVLFVFRDDYYLDREEPTQETPEWYEWQAKMHTAKGKAEVIIGKQRHGSTGIVYMAFDAERTAFKDLAPNDRLPNGRPA
jgi:replicative DNA helicase